MDKKEEIIKRLKQLSELIKKHNFNYHTLDKPQISDKEFDKLIQENDILEKKYPNLVLKNSPNRMYGGKIKETYGVPVSEIQEGIKHGVRKINIDTDLRLASTAAIRKHFTNDPAQFDPRKYLHDSKEWMKKIVIERLIQFGCAENADKIQPIPLKVIASQYLSGELSPLIN